MKRILALLRRDARRAMTWVKAIAIAIVEFRPQRMPPARQIAFGCMREYVDPRQHCLRPLGHQQQVALGCSRSRPRSVSFISSGDIGLRFMLQWPASTARRSRRYPP